LLEVVVVALVEVLREEAVVAAESGLVLVFLSLQMVRYPSLLEGVGPGFRRHIHLIPLVERVMLDLTHQ
jgi:hypothetical protein